MTNPSFGKIRAHNDVMKLIATNHKVILLGDLSGIRVKFFGPKGTLYEGGVWMVYVNLPEEYPFKFPYICFMNKIYHPNIDELTGTVCLINESWSALYDLCNIFDSFLPQLLTYPNAKDPLNTNAASMYLYSQDEYKKEVSDYVRQFAYMEILCFSEKVDSLDSESSILDSSEDEA